MEQVRRDRVRRVVQWFAAIEGLLLAWFAWQAFRPLGFRPDEPGPSGGALLLTALLWSGPPVLVAATLLTSTRPGTRAAGRAVAGLAVLWGFLVGGLIELSRKDVGEH